MRCALRPTKDDTPLIVDPDAVEPAKVTAEGLQPVARRRTKVREDVSRIDHVELPKRGRPNVGRERPSAARSRTVVEIRGGLVAERGDHGRTLPDARYPCKLLPALLAA